VSHFFDFKGVFFENFNGRFEGLWFADKLLLCFRIGLFGRTHVQTAIMSPNPRTYISTTELKGCNIEGGGGKAKKKKY
jgi:hypothetical protein